MTMSTGDLKNNVKQLVNELKTVKYGKTLDTDQIVTGSPKAYLPIYNFLFTSYNMKFNADIVNSNNELYGKSDMRFMEAIYKILRDMFNYKAKITRDQFFAPGFSEHKVIMARDVVRLVRGRYNPPKSTRFHVAGARSGVEIVEKVNQDPTEISQKVSEKKSIPSTVAAGAIVLPTRVTTGSSGYKIPKSRSGQGLPGPKHNQERPVFGEPLLTAPSSLSSSNASNRRNNEHAQSALTEHKEIRVIKANNNPNMDNFTPLPVSNLLPQVDAATAVAPVLDTNEIETIVRRKIVDLVSPAMVKINERVGILEITLEDLEEKEKQPVKAEPAPSAALINGLTQQMHDVVFKLQTLTSRITLLENRVTMVESQLNDEEFHRRTLFASQGYTKSKKSQTGIPQQRGEVLQRMPVKSSASTFESNHKLSGKAAILEKAQTEKTHKSGNQDEQDCNIKIDVDAEEIESIKICPDRNVSSGVDSKNHVNYFEQNPVKSPALAFMKTLVNPEDCTSLLTTSGAEPPEDLNATTNTAQQNESGVEEEVPPPAPSSLSEATTTGRATHNQQHAPSSIHNRVVDSSPPAQQNGSKPTKLVASKMGVPFSEDFSPIRPFCELSFMGSNQDESASMVLPSTGYVADESGLADRRSSTPTGMSGGLDTSTLDRISRINQLMAATEQMLH